MAIDNQGKKMILVVDDDREMVKMEKILFSRAGYLVMTALNGWDCMRVLADEKKPDIVLLDVMMPEQSGYDIYKKIREDPANNMISVLFYTGLPRHELDKIITLSGYDGYAEKSGDINALVEKVGEMTGKAINYKP